MTRITATTIVAPHIHIGTTEHGLGIIASKRIHSYECILELTGPLITSEEAVHSPEESFALQLGANAYIYLDVPARYVNHSCQPNAGIMGHFIVAILDIEKGDEICYDYSTTMDEDKWTMTCSCGSSLCRRTVKDFRTLPHSLQKRYLSLGIVQPFIVARLAQQTANLIGGTHVHDSIRSAA